MNRIALAELSIKKGSIQSTTNLLDQLQNSASNYEVHLKLNRDATILDKLEILQEELRKVAQNQCLFNTLLVQCGEIIESSLSKGDRSAFVRN